MSMSAWRRRRSRRLCCCTRARPHLPPRERVDQVRRGEGRGCLCLSCVHQGSSRPYHGSVDDYPDLKETRTNKVSENSPNVVCVSSRPCLLRIGCGVCVCLRWDAAQHASRGQSTLRRTSRTNKVSDCKPKCVSSHPGRDRIGIAPLPSFTHPQLFRILLTVIVVSAQARWRDRNVQHRSISHHIGAFLCWTPVSSIRLCSCTGLAKSGGIP